MAYFSIPATKSHCYKKYILLQVLIYGKARPLGMILVSCLLSERQATMYILESVSVLTLSLSLNVSLLIS